MASSLRRFFWWLRPMCEAGCGCPAITNKYFVAMVGGRLCVDCAVGRAS